MDIRGLANSATSNVNPNIAVTILTSNGYTIGSGLKQVPQYNTAVPGYAQMQALDNKDLKQLDGLNIQGTIRKLYIRGALAGVIRPDSKGGDIVQIGSQTWLTVKVLESWADWCAVAIVLQGD